MTIHISRRRLIKSSALGLLCAPAFVRSGFAQLSPNFSRSGLVGPIDFYVNSITGSPTNDGLSPATPKQFFRDVVSTLYQIDLNYQQVRIHDVPGHVDPGIGMSGSFMNQAGIPGVVFQCQGKFVPSQKHAGVEMSSGAKCSFENIYIDGTVQGAGSAPQDLFLMSDYSEAWLFGRNNYFLQYASTYNGITIVDSNLVIQPSTFGSQVANGSAITFGGLFQCGIQTDQGANVFAACNGQHGLIALYTIGTNQLSAPTWTSSFLDLAGGVCLFSGVDCHNTGANGPRARLRKDATLDLNLAQDPGQFNALPGSSGLAATTPANQGLLI